MIHNHNFLIILKGVLSVKEMDALQISSYESDPTKVLTSKVYEPTNFRNNFQSVSILDDFQSVPKYVDSDFTFIQNNHQ